MEALDMGEGEASELEVALPQGVEVVQLLGVVLVQGVVEGDALRVTVTVVLPLGQEECVYEEVVEVVRLGFRVCERVSVTVLETVQLLLCVSERDAGSEALKECGADMLRVGVAKFVTVVGMGEEE